MNAWVVRGLGMGLTYVLVRVFLAVGLAVWPLHGTTFKFLGIVVVIAIAALWGWRDAKADHEAHPAEGSGTDLMTLWMKAGVLGAYAAAVICWILSFLPRLDATAGKLITELTSGAAFTILTIAIPALTAVGATSLIRRLRGGSDVEQEQSPAGAADDDAPTEYIDNEYDDAGQYSDAGHYVDSTAETSVFHAVSDSQYDAGDAPTQQWQQKGPR